MRKVNCCKECAKEYTSGGLGLCSACLRKMKRRTRPIYYLRTCYGEIKRRCTQKVPNRDYSVYGKEFCTKDEFVDRFLVDEKFLSQYQKWIDSGYTRGSAPSIDRIDDEKSYTLDNLQFLSNIDNCKKYKSIPVGLFFDNNLINIFNSKVDLAREFNVSNKSINYYQKNNKLFQDKYIIKELDICII